jgi:hypothetical protein
MPAINSGSAPNDLTQTMGQDTDTPSGSIRAAINVDMDDVCVQNTSCSLAS